MRNTAPQTGPTGDIPIFAKDAPRATLLLNLEDEDLLSPKQMCDHPAFRNARGEPCHISKVYASFRKGLGFIKTPGGIRSSRQEIIRWLEKLNGLEGQSASRPASVRRAQRTIDAELDAAGIC